MSTKVRKQKPKEICWLYNQILRGDAFPLETDSQDVAVLKRMLCGNGQGQSGRKQIANAYEYMNTPQENRNLVVKPGPDDWWGEYEIIPFTTARTIAVQIILLKYGFTEQDAVLEYLKKHSHHISCGYWAKPKDTL